MTAQRWWVRLAARWLARVDGVSGMIQLAMLGLTGISTATLTLRQYGYGEYAWPFIAVVGLGTVAFTYLYTEGGVWNQMARDRQDLSRNYTTPKDRMNRIISTMALFYAFHGREPTPEEAVEIIEIIDEWWQQYRGGMDVDGDGVEPDLVEALQQ